MMIVIYIAVGIAALVGGILLIAAFMPSRYEIEQSIIIKKPVRDVYKNVADLDNYRDWNPWQKTEPQAKSQVMGEAGNVGHRYSWEGRKIGTGSMTLAQKNEFNNIRFELEFVKPWKSKADDLWNFEDQGEETRVIWRNEGELSFPMGKLMGPMIKNQLNDQFEEGLENLKELCEGSNSAESPAEIKKRSVMVML